MQVIRDCAAAGTPMLGVCLGHQALGEVFGGSSRTRPSSCTARPARSSTRARACSPACPTRSPRRGTTRSPSSTTRCPTSSRSPPTAHGIIMGLQHRTLPLYGVQFHPESVLTEGGHRLLANWLEICGDDRRRRALGGAAPARPAVTARTRTTKGPSRWDGPFVCRVRSSAVVGGARRSGALAGGAVGPLETWMSICWSNGTSVPAVGSVRSTLVLRLVGRRRRSG